MVLVKSFSISWKRDMFSIELMCFSPRGKEKIVKLYMPSHMVEHFAASLQKAVDKFKNRTPPEEGFRYIG
jgi:hypothetical protein